MVPSAQRPAVRRRPVPRTERQQHILDTAEPLFRDHGVRATGMDDLIAATGLAKMSVYRIYPTKDELVGATLDRLADRVLGLIDADIDAHSGYPAAALRAILDAVEADLRRTDFRGCPFGNAGAEFDDRDHPAQRVAMRYRAELRGRLTALAAGLGRPADDLGDELAVLIDGAYLSAAHLGPDGPAAAGLRLARRLVDHAS
jgi:AcrR family transcriptional regulator